MKKYSLETAVGIFIFIGLLCVGYLTVKLGKMEIVGGNFYTIYANFESIGGLKKDSSVRMAGVEIGRVGEIKLDTRNLNARIAMKIQNGIPVQDDAIASIRTSGLIGDKFVSISPGGSEDVLGNGDVLTDTEPAIDIETLISKYVFGDVKK